jgi:hypothetical protein
LNSSAARLKPGTQAQIVSWTSPDLQCEPDAAAADDDCPGIAAWPLPEPEEELPPQAATRAPATPSAAAAASGFR